MQHADLSIYKFLIHTFSVDKNLGLPYNYTETWPNTEEN